MTYTPDIPDKDNSVRDPVSGDLVLMRQNFQALEPMVVSGLHGLSGVDVAGAVSGEVLLYDGVDWVPGGAVGTLSGLSDTAVSGATSGQVLAWNESDWVPVTAAAGTLSGLTDTAVSGATSGQVLKWNGTSWVPGASATPALKHVRLVLSGDLEVADSVSTVISGFTEDLNVGGWVVDLDTGELQVISGITHVQGVAQLRWEGVVSGQRNVGMVLSGDAGTEDMGRDVRSSVDTNIIIHNAATWMVPVTGGEIVNLVAYQDSSNPVDAQAAGEATFLYLRGFDFS